MALTKIGATLGGSADVIQVTQNSHGLTLGYPVKMTASGYAHATADTAANAEVVGIIIATTTNTLTIALGGRITVDGCVPNVTAGTVLFLQVSAGLLAATEPSSAGQISKPMAVVTVANSEMIMVQQRGEVISTGGASIADGSITLAKMAVNSIDSDQYVDGSIDTVHIDALQVTGAKIANDTITEGKLDVSNAPTDGHFLQAQSGEGGGLTWAAASSGPSQATQSAIEAETNEDTYLPPDLMKYHPGVAVAWCQITAAGALVSRLDYNVATVDDTGTGNRRVNLTNATSHVESCVCVFGTDISGGGTRLSRVDTNSIDCLIYNNSNSLADGGGYDHFVAFGDFA